MDSLTPVTLVIKAPNQKIGDQTIECALDWTVKKLKQHISSVYPSKPAEKQQRIIYSGHLLQDHVQLKDILRQYEPDQQIHTVHLVCSPSTTDASYPNILQPTPQSSDAVVVSPSNRNSLSEGVRHRNVATTSTTTTNINETTTATSTNMPPSYTQMNSQPFFAVTNAAVQQPNAMFMYPAPGAMPTANGQYMAPMYTPEQMLWLQQTYAQYMAQYMQYYQSGYYQQQAYQPSVSQPQPANQQPANAGQAEPIVNRRQRPEVVRMNAQGGPAADDDDDDEMRNRDWLDWVYTSIRFLLLLSILYFYSSFDRFIAMMGLVLFIYLFQAEWFRRNAGRRHPPAAAGAAAGNVNAEQRQQDGDAVNDDRNQADGEDAAAAVTGDAGRQRPGLLSVMWTFMISFITSLAPQQPPPVNAN